MRGLQPRIFIIWLSAMHNTVFDQQVSTLAKLPHYITFVQY